MQSAKRNGGSRARRGLLLFVALLVSIPTGAQEPKAKTPPAPVRPGTLPQEPAQGNPVQVANDAFKSGGYLNALLALQEKREAWDNEPPWGSLAHDMIGTFAPFVGEHTLALGALPTPRGAPQPAAKEAALVAGYEPVDAVKTILQQARGRQVVMLNEEHRSSVQRAFANRLLDGLHRQGFRYLAMEAINEPGEDLNRRGYALTKATGLYTKDPALADLLRRAHALGFTLVPYEVDLSVARPRPEDKGDDATNRRERGQAENLFNRIFQKDPKAKVIVWAGRGHIAETQAGDWTPMGFLFKQAHGIDPLTVDLTTMVEGAAPEYEWAQYRAATAQRLVRDDAVVLRRKTDGSYFSLGQTYDLRVFQPRTRWVDGRPHWMTMGGLRKPIKIAVDRTAQREPLLLQAFWSGESADAVPLDQVVLWPDKPTMPALMLRKGRYQIKLVNRMGATLWSRDLRVR